MKAPRPANTYRGARRNAVRAARELRYWRRMGFADDAMQRAQQRVSVVNRVVRDFEHVRPT